MWLSADETVLSMRANRYKFSDIAETHNIPLEDVMRICGIPEMQNNDIQLSTRMSLLPVAKQILAKWPRERRLRRWSGLGWQDYARCVCCNFMEVADLL